MLIPGSESIQRVDGRLMDLFAEPLWRGAKNDTSFVHDNDGIS